MPHHPRLHGMPVLVCGTLVLTTLGGCAGQNPPRESLRPALVSGVPLEPPLMPAGGELVEDLSIGLADGPAEYTFGLIGDVALGPDGSIFVVDFRDRTVRQFDSSGRFVRNIGRRGNGPGEFMSPQFLTTDHEGRVLIADYLSSGARGPGRIHVYSSDGTFLQTWIFDQLIEGPITVDSAGTVYVRMAGAAPSNGRSPTRPGYIDSQATQRHESGASTYGLVGDRSLPPTSPGTVRVRPDGTRIDMIPPPVSDDLLLVCRPLPDNDRFAVTSRSYAPFRWWAWSPLGELLSGSSTEYSINIHAPSGSPEVPRLRLRGEVVPVQLAPEELEVIREEFGQLNEACAGPREIPSTKPAYHSVVATRQGGIWVGLHLPSVQQSGTGRWREPLTVFDVWEPTGRYLGRVQGPREIYRVVIDGNTLVTWTRDESGVQRVVRYRLVWY